MLQLTFSAYGPQTLLTTLPSFGLWFFSVMSFFFLKIVETKHRISRLVIQHIKVTSIFLFLVYYLLTLLNLYFLKLFLFILPDEECYAKFNLQNS